MGLRKPISFPVKCVSLPPESLQVMLGAGKHGTKGRKKKKSIIFFLVEKYVIMFFPKASNTHKKIC